MTKKHILVDDSNLLKSVSEVINEKPIVISQQRLKEKAKGDLNTAIRAVMLEDEQAAIASQDSLRNYPGSNAPTGDKTFPKPDVANADLYWGSKEGVAPRQEPNVGNTSDAKSVQRELVDAAQKVAAVWSKMLDPRNRQGSNDIIAAKRFLKLAFSSLLDEE